MIKPIQNLFISKICYTLSTGLLRLLWKLWLWLCFFTCLLVLLLTILFPRLPEYRPQIEQWVSQILKQPITIGGITTYWVDWMPTVALQQVRVLDTHAKQTVIDIAYAEMTFNVWASVKQAQIVTNNLVLRGSQFSLTRSLNGDITLVGLSETTSFNKPISIDKRAILQWLLQQSEVFLHATALTWLESEQLPLVFSNFQLTVEQQQYQPRITGSVDLPQSVIQGIQAKNISFESEVNLQQLTFNGQFTLEQLQLVSKSPLIFQRSKTQEKNLNKPIFQGGDMLSLGGNFNVKFADSVWQIDIKQHLINSKQIKWLPNQIQVRIAPKGIEINGNISVLPLDKLLNQLPPGFFTVVNPKIAQSLMTMQGTLHDIQWQYTPNHWQIHAHFVDLTMPAIGQLPSINGFSGHLEIEPDKGKIRFDQATVTLNIPTLYSHPLSLTQLKGRLNWQRIQQQWHLTAKQLQAFDKKMKITVNGYLNIPQQGEVPYSHLLVKLRNGQLSQILPYLPDKKLQKTVRWFNQAQLQGKLNQAHIQLQGPINALFDPKRGHFELKADINNTQLNYARGWPRLKNAKGAVKIQGRSLTITVQHGKILNSTVQHLLVEIADLSKPSLLNITASAQGQADEALRMIQQSPLHDQVDLDRLAADGYIGLRLKLAIPFSDEPNRVEGKIIFKNTLLHDKSFNLTVTDVTGMLSFSNEKVATKNMQGKLLGKPIDFSILTWRQKYPKRTTVQMSGVADSTFLSKQLARANPEFAQWPLHTFLAGAAFWELTMNVPNEDVIDNNYIDIHLEMNLLDMDIKLPAPLSKTAQEQRIVKIDIHLSSHDKIQTKFSAKQKLNPMLEKILIHLHYGNILNGVFHLNNLKLKRGNLVLGTTPAQLPKETILKINGYVPSLSITAWLNQLSTPNEKINEDKFLHSKRQVPIPIVVDISFDHLEMLGQNFAKIMLQAKSVKYRWRAAITGTHIEGQIIFDQFKKTPSLDLRFKKLTLTIPQIETKAQARSQQKASLQPHYLPTLSFHCDVLQIGDINLGNVDLHTQPSHDGLKINLEAQTIGLNLQAEGEWRYVVQRHQTILQVTLNSEKIGSMLQQLGYQKPPLVGGQTQITLNIYWFDTPYAFNLSTMVGVLNLVILEGSIIDVEPGIGRLFGLFDVYTLPRRLALDFSDVFDKGFGFGTIVGGFFIKQGIAHTKYLILQGSSARVEISGKTNLVEKYYDQIATVYPHFSAPLPIAGALAGGISGGAIALVVQQLLQTELKNVIKFQYHITGKWKKPNIVSISK